MPISGLRFNCNRQQAQRLQQRIQGENQIARISLTASLLELEVSNRKISTLAGLEKLGNLTTLNLSNNGLQSLATEIIRRPVLFVKIGRVSEIGLGRFRVAEQYRRVPSPQAAVYAEVEVRALLPVFA